MVRYNMDGDGFPPMTKSRAIQIKAICWLAIVGFAASSACYGLDMQFLFTKMHEPGFMGICGNVIADPLGMILSLGTPAGFAALLGFIMLSHQGYCRRWSIGTAAFIVVGCTAALLFFGIRYFHYSLPGNQLSDIVWWLKPFGLVLGI